MIRGEEHLSNTLRQSLLYEHLGLTPPAFAHLPLVLGPDRAKLSKRHGATSVGELRNLGYPPQAVVNHLALLGWSPGDDREVLSRAEIVERFTLERVSRSPSVFDAEKLEWFTSHHVKAMATEDVVAGILPFLEASGARRDRSRPAGAGGRRPQGNRQEDERPGRGGRALPHGRPAPGAGAEGAHLVARRDRGHWPWSRNPWAASSASTGRA